MTGDDDGIVSVPKILWNQVSSSVLWLVEIERGDSWAPLLGLKQKIKQNKDEIRKFSSLRSRNFLRVIEWIQNEASIQHTIWNQGKMWLDRYPNIRSTRSFSRRPIKRKWQLKAPRMGRSQNGMRQQQQAQAPLLSVTVHVGWSKIAQCFSGRQNLWNDFNHGVPERGVWEQVCPNNFEQSQIGPSEIEHNWCREWDTKR